MPITLRARPTCHYCGKRNSPLGNQNKFTCQHCQAENYLDESGQITDVPASVAAASSEHFAVPLESAFPSTEETVFCSTCLKNQYMYNMALAEYLPDPDHPEYDRFEAAIPAFKKDLERRFPTCCAACEPKVRAQLQQATYNARSDHVRRVLDRSRQRRNANRWGWRSLLVSVAGLGWHVSLLVQLVWHMLGSQTHTTVSIPAVHVKQCVTAWPVPRECPLVLEPVVGPSLLLGIMCIWWNPRWQHKLQGREGRLTGLDKFYKVQSILMGLRFATWTVAKDVPALADVRPMVHTISLILIAMIAGWSQFGIIRIYMPQIVNWAQDPTPLLDHKQYVPPPAVPMLSPPHSQEPVPVNIFNTAVTSDLQHWRPPTPPADEDAMEWDPTPTAFSPRLRKVKYKSSAPTPFHGTLPALPQSTVYRSQQAITAEKPKAIGLPPGFFDKQPGHVLHGKRKDHGEDAEIAQPKFFPDFARADTGLENIFDKVFSIHDAATAPGQTTATSSVKTSHMTDRLSTTQQAYPVAYPQLSSGTVWSILVITLLLFLEVAFAMQYYLELSLPRSLSAKSIVKVLIVMPLSKVIGDAAVSRRLGMVTGEYVKIALAMSQSLGLYVLQRMEPEDQSLLLPLWNKLVIAALTAALVQSIYRFCVEDQPDSHIPDRSAADTQATTHSLIKIEDAAGPAPLLTDPPNLRRSSSGESLASTTSIATTSTASGWKTPVRNHREELKNLSSSTSHRFGGLSLKNDHAFGVGGNVAGPRTTRASVRR